MMSTQRIYSEVTYLLHKYHVNYITFGELLFMAVLLQTVAIQVCLPNGSHIKFAYLQK